MDDVSWEDIEEEVSTATGNIGYITMAITVCFVGQLEWKHKRKNRKRKGIIDK